MSEKNRFWIVFGVSMAFSIGGIFFGAFYTANHADGGRGGAVGTAIALAFMFITRDYGVRFYAAVTKGLPDLEARIKRITDEKKEQQAAPKHDATLPELQQQVDALVGAIGIDAKGQKTQNYFLALATFVGTMTWGFGDLAAQFLIQHPRH
jgi:hypothetical protein